MSTFNKSNGDMYDDVAQLRVSSVAAVIIRRFMNQELVYDAPKAKAGSSEIAEPSGP